MAALGAGHPAAERDRQLVKFTSRDGPQPGACAGVVTEPVQLIGEQFERRDVDWARFLVVDPRLTW